MVHEFFLKAGHHHQQMPWSQWPEMCVKNLQRGAQKQFLHQLNPEDFGVHEFFQRGIITSKQNIFLLLPATRRHNGNLTDS
jgi:hypothetical protein